MLGRPRQLGFAAVSSAAARLVVLASGGGRTLENLAQNIQAGRLNARIDLVIVSRKEAKALQRARDLGLMTLVIGRQSHPDRERREHCLLGAILEARPDFVIMAGWLQLLPIPPSLEGKVLNIHPALLPAYGGRGYYGERVHQAVVADGVPLSGCTVHFATEAYDEGPIVVQEAVATRPGESADDLAARVFEAEKRIYPEALDHLIEGRAYWQDGKVRWQL